MMIFLFFETLVRTLMTLAQASWRKMPRTKWKLLRWAKFYLTWAPILVGVLILAPRRGVLFCALYSWLRPADDILDGELKGPQDVGAYIGKKSDLIRRFGDGTLCFEHVHGLDRLLMIALWFAHEVNMLDETQRYVPIVWKHMVDDWRWRTTKTIPTADDLAEFACSQDEAIFRFAALILGADARILDLIAIEKTGVFTRTDWMADMAADLKVGLIHLPAESCRLVGIIPSYITGRNAEYALRNSQPLRALLLQEVRRLNTLWEKVDKRWSDIDLSFSNKMMGFLFRKVMLDGIRESRRKMNDLYG